jgi:hypothetical protein
MAGQLCFGVPMMDGSFVRSRSGGGWVVRKVHHVPPRQLNPPAKTPVASTSCRRSGGI